MDKSPPTIARARSPPLLKPAVERGGSMCIVCVWARVHAYAFAQTEFKQVGDH